MGWNAHPLIKGDYPPVMREFIDKKSSLEGQKESRLPKFSPEWIQRLKGKLDFLGLNYYTTHIVKPAPLVEQQGWGESICCHD